MISPDDRFPTTEQVRKWCAKGFQASAPPAMWADGKMMAGMYDHGLELFDQWLTIHGLTRIGESDHD